MNYLKKLTVASPLTAALICALALPSPGEVFPTNNVWNTPITAAPVDPNSNSYVNSIGTTASFHPDFGSNLSYGIPFNIVPINTKRFPLTFQYASESDPGPYPINNNMKIEGGTWSASNNGDRHVVVVCGTILYETWSTYGGPTSWTAGSGAIFDLSSNALRPNTWTSSDAAGLPIYPALLKYSEAASGQPITHALRFTCQRTSGTYIWPARHAAGSATSGAPPFGQRFRLKAGHTIPNPSAINQAIITCMQNYGLILADIGSNWYVQGASDARWNDNDLNNLKQLKGSDFEAINESTFMVNPDSGQMTLP